MKLTKEQKFLKQIIQEAWENETFKNELIANPIKAIEKLTGKKINVPGHKKLVIVDQSDTGNVYVNIPADPTSMELSEEQLEAVAGGTQINTVGEDCNWGPGGPPWGGTPPFSPY